MTQELAEECIYMRTGNTASLIYPASQRQVIHDIRWRSRVRPRVLAVIGSTAWKMELPALIGHQSYHWAFGWKGFAFARRNAEHF
jgi:hypothetical protein